MLNSNILKLLTGPTSKYLWVGAQLSKAFGLGHKSYTCAWDQDASKCL